MGYIRHDAIIVTTWDSKPLEAARKKAIDLGLSVSGPVTSKMNGYISCLIGPDGSKEGWEDSDLGDLARAEWKAWAQTCDADEIYFDWVHLSYAGDDPRDTRIIDQSKHD